jgi:hypothetical protein
MKKLILVALMALIVSPAWALVTLPDGADAYWAINDATHQADAQIIFENPAKGYTFGMYDKINIANKLEVFTGSNTTGDQAVMTVLGNSPGSLSLRTIDTTNFVLVDTAIFAANAFGFYLIAPTGATFYSDTLLNPGQIDHMTATTGGSLLPGSEYQLSWDGFTVNVESVHQLIPEPASLLLLTLGALSLRIKKLKT